MRQIIIIANGINSQTPKLETALAQVLDELERNQKKEKSSKYNFQDDRNLSSGPAVHIKFQDGSFSFSRLFHEIFHDGTASYAQHYGLNRSRPVFNISRYFVTLSMMGNQFRYITQERMQLSSRSKIGNLFCLSKGLLRVAVKSTALFS